MYATKLLTNGVFAIGACLTCGGTVNVLGNGADSIRAHYGPVEFDVQIRNGIHVEGSVVLPEAMCITVAPLDPDDDVPFKG